MKLAVAVGLLLLVVWGVFVTFPTVPAGVARLTDAPPVPVFSGPRPHPTPGGEIFEQPTVVDFELRFPPASRRALRENAREYAPATVLVNGVEFTNVAVKLKGAAGSFRSLDDRPALTLSFNKHVEGRRVFGLRRLHLNNSVQDPSYLSEYVGSALFRAAGIPTPRVAWATVRLDDRPLGLYVLKEAFEKEFLRCHFEQTDGNLYDGGFLSDVDRPLERDGGFGPADHADLEALADAARENDPARRWQRLQEVLDVERFATYAALSVMLVDWDGYPLNRNNYRVYFNPADGRAVFMPHGMDQLFQRTYLELDQGWAGLVAWAVFSTEPGQALYEARCRTLFTNLFALDRITNLVERAAAVLAPVVSDMPMRAVSFTDQVTWRLRALRRDPLLQPPAPVTAVAGNAPAGSPAAATP